MFWFGLSVGLFIGGNLGVIVMACFSLRKNF